MIGLIIVCLGSAKIASNLLQRQFIDSLYGQGAYAHGLHMVGKNGQLSDGRQMPADVVGLLSFCWVILSLLPVLAYMAILSVLGVFPPERLFEKLGARQNAVSPNPPIPPWLRKRLSRCKTSPPDPKPGEQSPDAQQNRDWKKTWG
jgi:hypothetical protein